MAESFFQQIKDEPLTRELAQKIIKETKGEARGMNLKTDWSVVLREKGEEGLVKLEKKMAEVGFPVKYKTIKTMGFYPLGMDAVSLLAIRDVFGFEEKDFVELGAKAVKASLFFKVMLKYFSSFSLAKKQVSKFWRKHFTVGELKVAELNEKEGRLIFKLENFNVHPLSCATISGYFVQSIRMVTGQTVSCREVKCMARGDDYHEFILKWK